MCLSKSQKRLDFRLFKAVLRQRQKMARGSVFIIVSAVLYAYPISCWIGLQYNQIRQYFDRKARKQMMQSPILILRLSK